MTYKGIGECRAITLTTAIGESVTGTAGNDTFSTVLDGAAGATGTLNTGDQISGGAGIDTLNVLVTAASTPAVGNVIKDVEIINFTHVGASGALTLSSANYSGITQLWQVDNTNAAGNFQNVVVAADVTAGFKSTGAAGTAALLQTSAPANVAVDGTSAAQTSVAVALDGVLGGAGSGLTFGATTGTFATITVSGSTVAATAAGNTLALVDDTGTKTLNLGLTSATTVNITDADNSITKVDLTASTGNVTVGTSLGGTLTGVKTVIGGSGNNTFTVDMGTAVAGMNVDLGAGNDTLNLTVTGTTGDTNGTVTLGAGKDTVFTAATISNIVTAGGGVTAATADELLANIVTITDFKTSEDVLDLTVGTALTSGQLATINGSASLLAATQAAAAILNNTAGQVVFSYGGDAYVFNEVGGAAAAGVNNGDGLIKLTGVDATEFTNIQNGNLVL